MPSKHERLTSLIELVIKSVYNTTDHKVVYEKLEEVLKQLKFNEENINVEQFEDTLFFALKEYLRERLLTSDAETKKDTESLEETEKTKKK